MIATENTTLEMVTCPVCGKPFPKLRRNLGYKCCVSCSTESPVTCIIEGIPEEDGGDGVQSRITLISKSELEAINASSIADRYDSEEALDMLRTEDDEEVVSMSYEVPISSGEIKFGFRQGLFSAESEDQESIVDFED